MSSFTVNNSHPAQPREWESRDVTLRNVEYKQWTRKATWGEWFTHGLATFGLGLAGVVSLGTLPLFDEDYRRTISEQHNLAWNQTHVEAKPRTKEMVKTKMERTRFTEKEILADIGNQKFSKVTIGGSEYWVRLNPKDSSFVWMPLTKDGAPDVDNARITTFSKLKNNEGIADEDLLRKSALTYLKYWDHLGDKGMSDDVIFVMDLQEGTAWGFKHKPGTEVALDDIRNAHISYDSILPDDVKKSIKKDYVTEQNEPNTKKAEPLDPASLDRKYRKLWERINKAPKTSFVPNKGTVVGDMPSTSTPKPSKPPKAYMTMPGDAGAKIPKKGGSPKSDPPKAQPDTKHKDPMPKSGPTITEVD